MSYQRLHEEPLLPPSFTSRSEKGPISQINQLPEQYGAEIIPMQSSYEPFRNSQTPQHHGHHKKLGRVRKMQRMNDISSAIFKIASGALAAFMAVAIAYALAKFYTTKNLASPEANRASPWAEGTVLWPAFLLAASSTLTLLTDTGGFISACCRSRSKRAERAEKAESVFVNIGRVVVVIQWLAVAVLYRMGRTSKDLWGWSCGPTADQIQQFYPQVPFGTLCTMQVCNPYLSVLLSANNL